MATDKPGFLDEVKRRHVWRVAIAYAVAGWLLVQVATQVFPFFNIPNWAVRLVVLLIVIGFLVAVAFAWIYEMTPEGIRRTAPADSPDARAEHESRQMGRKLNTVIITILILAVALLGWQVLVLRRAPVPAVAESAAAASKPAPASGAHIDTSSALANTSPLPASTAAIPEKSVAVLPFANEGEQGEQFFSDGLSEDLINALSQFAGLKVISRNSAFQFRGSKESSKAIGVKLGVAHLLEGTVQHADGAVRVTATLVNAADGSTLWSRQYDRPYRDLFALQDTITRAVADALQAKLLMTPGAVAQSDRPPGGNLAAFAAYKRGVAYAALTTDAGTRQAIDAFGVAIRLDPAYVAAYALLSRAWTHLGASGVETARARDMAHKSVAAALKLDPDSSLAHQAHAYWFANAVMDWAGAEAEYQRALQLSPNDVDAQVGLARVLASLGQNARAVRLTRHALISDPRRLESYFQLSTSLTALGELDDAREAINTVVALRPGAAGARVQHTIIDILRGDAAAALAIAQREPPGVWHEVAIALASQVAPDRLAADGALATLIRDYADISPYQIAEVYALRRDPDAMFKWLDRAWTGRDAGLGLMLSDPLILRYQHDPRFAAFAKKVGLPTTTDAVAMK